MPTSIKREIDVFTGEVLSEQRVQWYRYKIKFTKIFHEKMNKAILELSGDTLKFLFYIVTSGMVRFGENSFMINPETKKKITTDLKITDQAIYRYLRTLKEASIVYKIGNGCYKISTEHMEYGNLDDSVKTEKTLKKKGAKNGTLLPPD